jgi:glyceraldehyde-3-phosphate dehydrogenase (NADP+)
MNDFSTLFPEEKSIPASVKLPVDNDQREYLINGEMRSWQGGMSPVASPIFVRDGAEYKQKIIGSTPLLTSKEALEALDAALNAYDLGHGAWPMMTVADRIHHVEIFLGKMKEKRQEVVNL